MKKETEAKANKRVEWKELEAEENHGTQVKDKGVKREWRVKRKVKEIGQNNEMGKDTIRN